MLFCSVGGVYIERAKKKNRLDPRLGATARKKERVPWAFRRRKGGNAIRKD